MNSQNILFIYHWSKMRDSTVTVDVSSVLYALLFLFEMPTLMNFDDGFHPELVFSPSIGTYFPRLNETSFSAPMSLTMGKNPHAIASAIETQNVSKWLYRRIRHRYKLNQFSATYYAFTRKSNKPQ